jgi:hypothetical protein
MASNAADVSGVYLGTQGFSELKQLLACKASANVHHSFYGLPLALRCRQGVNFPTPPDEAPCCIQALLNAGADPNAGNFILDCRTPTVVQLLLRANASCNSSRLAILHKASTAFMNTDILQLLLQAKTSVHDVMVKKLKNVYDVARFGGHGTRITFLGKHTDNFEPGETTRLLLDAKAYLNQEWDLTTKKRKHAAI